MPESIENIEQFLDAPEKPGANEIETFLDAPEKTEANDIEQFLDAPEKPYGESVKENIGQVLDVGKQIGIGVLKGAKNMGETIRDLIPDPEVPGGMPKPLEVIDIAQIEKDNPALSVAGDFSREGARFLTGMIPASKALSSLGMANKLVKAMSAGAIADFSVFDPYEVRLSDLVQSVPELQNPVTEYLSVDKDDSKLEGRIKSVLEGAGLGLGVEGVMRGIKAVKGIKKAKEASPVSIQDAGDTNRMSDNSVGAAQADVMPQDSLEGIATNTKRVLNNFKRNLVDMTGGKAISYLDDLGKRSPTAKMFRNALEAEEFSKVPQKADFTQRVSRNTGDLITRMQKATRAVTTKFRGKLPKGIDEQITRGLRGETVKGHAAQTAVRELRGLLNRVYAYARTGDTTVSVDAAKAVKKPIIDIGYIDNWFPRNYISGRVTRAQKKNGKISLSTDEGRTAFIRVLNKYGIEVTQGDEIAEKITRQGGILDGAQSEVQYASGPRDLNTRTVPNELSRKLTDIPDKELFPFLHDDSVGTIKSYIQSIVKRVEMARIVGQGGGKMKNIIADITEEARQSGKPLTISERDRMINLVNATQRTYRPLSGGVKKAYVLNNTYQFMRTLPLATLSSLSEPFVVLLRGRTSSAIKSIPETINHAVTEAARMFVKGIPKAQATKYGEFIGSALDADVTERMAATFGGEFTKVGDVFFKTIGLQQWTRFNRIWGATTSRRMIKDNLVDLLKYENKSGLSLPKATSKKNLGKVIINKRYDELVELGIEPSEGIRWLRAGAKMDDPFVKQIDDASVRFTNEVVMNPRVANLPMLASRPSLQPLFQLKKFQLTFGNTVVKRLYNEMVKRGPKEGAVNTAKIASVVSMMVATAMLSNEIREQIKYGDEGNPKFKGETSEDKMLRALERTGLLGLLQLGSDALFAHRFGSKGPLQMGGPTVTQFADINEAVGRAVDPENESDKKWRGVEREVVNALPYINVTKRTRKAAREAFFGSKDD